MKDEESIDDENMDQSPEKTPSTIQEPERPKLTYEEYCNHKKAHKATKKEFKKKQREI